MTLIENAGALYLRLKSNQLMLLVGIVLAADAGWSAYQGGGWIVAAISAALSFGATIARVIAQPETIAKVEQQAVDKEIEAAIRQDQKAAAAPTSRT